jgi:three-Cys-motif partner protein
MSNKNLYHLQDSAEFPEIREGVWASGKLEAFTKYISAYLAILQADPDGNTIYFDGLSGSGSRQNQLPSLYDQLRLTPEEERVYQHAAEQVIRLDKSFDYYYFVDTWSNLEPLQERVSDSAELNGKRLFFRQEECNHELRKLAYAMQSDDYAALVFLDPFGMGVEWPSIAGLQGTRSDIWILLPTGVMVDRFSDTPDLLTDGAGLESCFGLSGEEIRREFQKEEKQITLFGEDDFTCKICYPIQHIANLYIRQLKTGWKYVSETPLVLYNSRHVPVYHFVYATNNETARNIAGDIIGDGQ